MQAKVTKDSWMPDMHNKEENKPIKFTQKTDHGGNWHVKTQFQRNGQTTCSESEEIKYYKSQRILDLLNTYICS